MPQKKSQENAAAFKHWINEALVKKMAEHIRHHYPQFDSRRFVQLSPQLAALEMKSRIRLICDYLHSHLPQDYKSALRILLKATTAPHPKYDSLKGFDLWAFTEFVHRYGLEDLDASLRALHTLTQRFTGEFAIRPFLIHRQEETLAVLKRWAHDKNYHVRRLVSEGSRPRLPWGEVLQAFIKDPKPTLALLEELKYDDELYVRKSVANHLNDITKTHPDLVLRTLKSWSKNCPAEHQEKVDWITRHALRTQIKAGNPKALRLLGYHTDAEVRMSDLKLRKSKVKAGDYLEFSFSLTSRQMAKVVVDYAIHYKKSNGGNSSKVFKLANKELPAREPIVISKRHSFKPVTTRRLYSGRHIVEILVNGRSLGRKEFQVQA